MSDTETQLREQIAQLEKQVAELRQQNSELLSDLEWHQSAATTNAAIVAPLRVAIP